MNDDILVLGATGTTGSRVADGLRERSASVRSASRTDAGAVRFDWHDKGSWSGALDGVRAIYLIGPGDAPDPASLVVTSYARRSMPGRAAPCCSVRPRWNPPRRDPERGRPWCGR